MPLIKWRPSLMISYPVERNFAAAVFWHRIAWVLKLLAVPALAFWIVWDNLMQEKAFISPTFSDADTYLDKKMHKIDCVPTRLRSGDRFFTDAGVFEWDYFGNLLYNQNGTHEYQGGDIGRCDVAEFRTVVDPSREEAVVSHIYVVCNTPDFKGMLHTSTTGGAPRDVELLNRGPPRKAWDYSIADKKSLAAAAVEDHYKGAANILVNDMWNLYKNATGRPVRMKLQPYDLGCWNHSETAYEACFNRRGEVLSSHPLFSQSEIHYSNGTVRTQPDSVIWPSVNGYFNALRDAVRYDLGSPSNGSNPLVKDNSQRKPEFDVYYECKRMEFKDPAGAIIAFVSTFYGLWKSWEAFVEFFFVLFSKKQPEDEDKPGGTPDEGVPMLGHNPPHQFVAK